jgi:hypothetical protein
MAKHGLPSLAGPKVQESLRRWDAEIDRCLAKGEEEEPPCVRYPRPVF